MSSPAIPSVAALVAAVLLLGSACAREPRAPVSSGWPEFVDAHLEAYFAAHPAFAVSQGRHEYDGLFPDWSADGIAGEIERLREERRRALAFADEGLTAGQRFERRHLLAAIDRTLFWLAEAEWPFRNPVFYFDWLLDSLDPNVYISRPYAPPAERLAAYTRWAENLPAAVAQVRANLRTPMPRTWVERGISAFAGLAEYFETDVPAAFEGAGDAALQERFAQANAAAAVAMRGLAAWLEEQRGGASGEYALGEELFVRMLSMVERVEIPLDELEAMGRADLERNVAALTRACAEWAPGLDVGECMDRARANKPEGGAVAGARAQLADLKEFLLAESLVTIPGTEEALVEEAPPYNRANFAYIDIPGPYDVGMPSVYYIAPPDPSWPPEVQAEFVPGRADLLFTSVHEVWPGHFLQYLHANRVESRIGGIFVGYANSEGWAHYTEEMMWEAGYGAGDPEIHIGQLSNALLRNARLLSAIGLHARGMSVEESERLFVEEAFQDVGTARQQAARGTYDPAYLNYTMGKLLIRELREEWCAERGGRVCWGEFHDAFLSYGGPPIPLVRAAMLGE